MYYASSWLPKEEQLKLGNLAKMNYFYVDCREDWTQVCFSMSDWEYFITVVSNLCQALEIIEFL